MFKIKYIIFVLLLSVFFVTGCSEFQKVLKSSDYNLKYEKALEYYNDEDYYRAQSLLEEIVPIFKGTDKAEKVYYMYAYCLYNQGEHIMAGYHFKNFARTYPNSKHVEECEYMSAYCQYLNSPEPSLDQTYTRKAINALQLFMNKYPKSDKVEKCNELIDELHKKLETKAFNSAMLYYKISDYQAAITTFKNVLIRFPDTHYREEILFYILKSSYLYAQNSIEKRKKERYKSTITEYYALIDEFAKTTYIKQAEKIFDNSRKNIK